MVIIECIKEFAFLCPESTEAPSDIRIEVFMCRTSQAASFFETQLVGCPKGFWLSLVVAERRLMDA